MDWSDPDSPISRHFGVREATFLPRWNRLATADDGLDDNAKAGLIDLFQKVDVIRDWAQVGAIVHVAFRPGKYNVEVGGAPQSCHVARKILVVNQWVPVAAVDLHFDGKDCDVIRRELAKTKLLEQLGLRMESNQGAWIHLDNRPLFPGGRRIFTP